MAAPRPLTRTQKGALVIFAVIFWLAVSFWALLAVSIPLEPGEPCGGDTLNTIQKVIAGGGWCFSFAGLLSALSAERGGGGVARATAATILAFGLWLLLLTSATC